MSALRDDITLICGFAIFVGLVGTVLPILPGGVLIAVAVLVWALVVQTVVGWVVLAAVVLLITAGAVLKYFTAGKRMVSSGVPNMSLVAGGLLGIVGFFVIPVIGLFIGFVLGVYAAERRRLGPTAAAPATRQALSAVGLSILIELTASLLAVATWVVGVVVTG